MFLLNAGPDVGWFTYPPLAGPLTRHGKRADVWAQLITFTEVSGAGRGGRDHRHRLQAARAGHDAEPHPALRLGACRDVVHGDVRDAGGDARQHRADPRPPGRHAFLRRRGGRRRRCSGSTCSGSSATPRSTSSSSRRPGSSRRSSRTFSRPAALRLPGRRARRWSRRRSWASGCGCTTCSRPGCRSSAQSFFTAASIMIAIPTGIADLLLDRDDVVRRSWTSRRRCSGCSASSPSSSSAG